MSGIEHKALRAVSATPKMIDAARALIGEFETIAGVRWKKAADAAGADLNASKLQSLLQLLTIVFVDEVRQREPETLFSVRTLPAAFGSACAAASSIAFGGYRPSAELLEIEATTMTEAYLAMVRAAPFKRGGGNP
jgi:hypothetical protein